MKIKTIKTNFGSIKIELWTGYETIRIIGSKTGTRGIVYLEKNQEV